MFQTMTGQSNTKLLDETDSIHSQQEVLMDTNTDISNQQQSKDKKKKNKKKDKAPKRLGPLVLRMKKIDIETIYPQHEKDREGEKLKRLCDMQETQKAIFADGNMLIENFVKPRHEVNIDHVALGESINKSHIKNHEQQRFLRRIDRQALKYNNNQYMQRVARAEANMRAAD